MKAKVSISYLDARLKEVRKGARKDDKALLARMIERFSILDVDVKQRLEVLNDHKKEMENLRHEFPNIHRYEIEICNMKDTLQELRDFKIQMKTTASQKDLNSTRIIAIMGLVVSIITLVVLIIKTFSV